MTLDEERAHINALLAQLERRLDAHEDKLNRLDTVPGTLDKIDRRLWENDRTLLDFKAALELNTTITRDIRDAQIAGRVLTGATKWIAGLILGAAGVWAAFKGVTKP